MTFIGTAHGFGSQPSLPGPPAIAPVGGALRAFHSTPVLSCHPPACELYTWNTAPFGVTAQLSETAAGLQVIVLTAVERVFHAAAASALAVLPYRREAYLANQPSSGCAVGFHAVSNVNS